MEIPTRFNILRKDMKLLIALGAVFISSSALAVSFLIVQRHRPLQRKRFVLIRFSGSWTMLSQRTTKPCSALILEAL